MLTIHRARAREVKKKDNHEGEKTGHLNTKNEMQSYCQIVITPYIAMIAVKNGVPFFA